MTPLKEEFPTGPLRRFTFAGLGGWDVPELTLSSACTFLLMSRIILVFHMARIFTEFRPGGKVDKPLDGGSARNFETKEASDIALGVAYLGITGSNLFCCCSHFHLMLPS